ncbi:MAG: alpha/beta fold hydrolase [Frankiales bacterium]|nr:alpha/beta fold hydrolase [Frankiales bacterium]
MSGVGRGVRLGVAAALTALACIAPGAAGRTTPARAATGSIAWHTCADSALAAAGAKCGFVTVPLDYANLSGAHLRIAVSRIAHTSSDADYQGVIVVNPGGPGASGLDQSTLGADVPNGVGADYDWIGFDPRGVGDSRPAMRCIPTYFRYARPDYRPRSTHLVREWRKRTKRYADACAKKYPDLIKHMTTADTARDMNTIRTALGVKKISFYGFSYGTYLGQVYATLFPRHLARMVLDSTVDPRHVWYADILNQDKAFNRNIRIWFRWLARYHRTYHLGRTTNDVSRLWYRELDRLAKHPAGGKVGPDEWTDAFLYAGYYRDTWLELGRDFRRFVNGDHWRPIADFYAAFNGPGDDNSYAVYSAVQCSDAHWPRSWRTWRTDAGRMAAKAPFLTWDNLWFNAPCLYWPVRAGKPMHINGSHVSSVLLVGETLDAATPYAGSLEVRRLFPNASLIAEPGGMTHADSLSGDRCVDDRIAAYLATGARPARRSGNRADHICKPLPDPHP